MTQDRDHPQAWFLPEVTDGGHAVSLEVADLVQDFAPISLGEIESVALFNRIDTKFVMTYGQLLKSLNALRQDYSMLVVQGRRTSCYRTLYFDTPDFELYHMHVNGRADRYKVRSREYIDSRLSFLEVKHRTHKDRMIKDRLSTSQPLFRMTDKAEAWLHEVFPYDARALQPTLWSAFTRMTLVGKELRERVTLDVDLTFCAADRVLRLDKVVIAEVKTDSRTRNSPFVAQMRAQRIHPCGFSKYAVGVSLLHDQVKKNALKPKILWLEKITGGVYHE